MSCRHDLALNTCRECYPKTGTITPSGPGDSMDGPGAVPRAVLRDLDWDSDEDNGDVIRLGVGCMTFDVSDPAKARAFCAAIRDLFNKMGML